MNYCSGCGKETTAKVCPHCGVKQGTVQRYCRWCGEELAPGAAICTNCQEPAKTGSVLGKIGFAFAGALMFIMTISFFSTSNPGGGILCALAFVACLPFAGKMILKKTHGKFGLRKGLRLLRVLLPIIALVVGLSVEQNAIQSPAGTMYKKDAIAAAEVLFHEQVKLKNESSYVLNDAEVSAGALGYPAFNEDHELKNENIRLVIVKLDVSAENSYGGMERKTYKMQFYYYAADGNYYRFDGSKINIP